MEFFDKLTKKATETYKGAAEKTGKIAKETKLRLKINENKSKINDLYEEIGKKVYQKHKEHGDVCVKNDIEDQLTKIDILANEIEMYNREILELSDQKECVECKEKLSKDAKFCPKCGAKQPEESATEEREEDLEALEAEVVDSPNNISEEQKKDIQEDFEKEAKRDVEVQGTEVVSNEENDENKE